MTGLQRVAQGVLVVLGALTILFQVSVYFVAEEDRFSSDANGMIAPAGAALGVLVIALALSGLGSGERWAWLSLWVLPVYLLSHVVLLGTWMPDAGLAVLAVLGLVLTRPRYGAGD